MIINTQNLQAINRGFNTSFNKGMAAVKLLYPELAMEIPSVGASNTYPIWDKFPSMREWKGDRQTRNLAPSDFVIRNLNFETTVEVDRDHIDDDTYGLYTPEFETLGMNAFLHRDVLLYNLLNDAFDGTYYPCYDGKAMIASDHKLGTRTFNNLGTAALSRSSFGTGVAALMSAFTDEKVIVSVPSKIKLAVAPSNFETAYDICKSQRVIGDATAGGSKDNAWQAFAEPVIIPTLELTPTYWFLIAHFGSIKPIIMQIRRKPEFVAFTKPTDESVFETRMFRYGADDRKNVGWGPFNLIYGSKGLA